MYKQYASALWEAIKRKDLPTPAKVMMGFGLAYILSPVDIIPDLVSGVGIIDDAALTAALIGVCGKLVLDRLQSGRQNPPGGNTQTSSGTYNTSSQQSNTQAANDTVDSHFVDKNEHTL